MIPIFTNPIAIFVNNGKALSDSIVEGVENVLQKNKIKYVVVPANPDDQAMLKRDFSQSNFSWVVSIGGDGTMLQAAHRFSHATPILGINAGHIGFLTSLDIPERHDDSPSARLWTKIELEKLLHQHHVRERQTLDVSVISGKKTFKGWAVNDVVISRGSNPHLINLLLAISDNPTTNYRCDGVIVTTPNGSTAYNLAAGGPIISPESDAICITPICPQALSSRSVVVAPHEKIQLRLQHGPGTVVKQGLVTCDSIEVAKVDRDSEIKITSSFQRLKLIYPSGWNYYENLNKKLGWTGDGIKC